MNRRHLLLGASGLIALSACAKAPSQGDNSVELLNVSYDPTRELYDEYNVAFAKYYKAKTGQTVTVRQSHGGSGKQARSVIDGLEADVVTLALGADIDSIAKNSGLLPSDWQTRLRDNSAPYTSTIVFLVRKGNPKAIKDWGDLIRPGIGVITPNPKTSGGARWNYLAAFGYALKANGGDEGKALDYMRKLFANVPVLDAGARGATTTFVQRGLGDVLLAWENEAYLAVNTLGKGQFEIITPKASILAEPPVAWVDKVVNKKGTQAVAKAYLEYLYSDVGQTIIGNHYYRPINPAIAAKFADKFPKLEMSTIADFGGWQQAQAKHFDAGGIFDSLTIKTTS
jgi:sulfate/thiosulfate transport system substrate-binding protein